MISFFRSLYTSTVTLSAPLILCSLGGLVSLHSGIVNVAMEGMMLSSAFVSVVVSYITGNPWLAMLAGMGSGVLISMIYSLFVINLKTNNFALGIALNVFVSSLTLFLTRIMFKGEDAFNSPDLVAIPKITFHTGIEVIDFLFSDFSILIYLAVILVFVINFVIYKTPFGLWLRAAGSFPDALSTSGKHLTGVQYAGSVLTGCLCGLAGSQQSLSNVLLFSRDMTAGRGFICLAAILIARGKPKQTFLISVLFGLFAALAVQLQFFNVPPHFLSMIPYFAAIIALIIMDRRDVKLV